MATNMNVSIRYSSFLPILLEAIARTNGDILELGSGVFSTPILHWICERDKRNLTTIENSYNWHYFSRKYYRTEHHKHIYVEDWDDADDSLNKKWDVVLVDHSPSDRRVVEIQKLANKAKYLILHDSDVRWDKRYHYSKIYPLFKYRFDFDKIQNATTVLSNLVDLTDFTI